MPGNLPEDYGTSTELAPYKDSEEEKKQEKEKKKQKKEKEPSAAERLAGASGAAVDAVRSKLKRDTKKKKTEEAGMDLNSILELHREMISAMQKDQEGVRTAERENRRLLASTLAGLDTLREEMEASTEAFEEATRQSKQINAMLEEHLLDAVQARQGTTYIGWVLDAIKIGLGVFACFKLGQIATRLHNPYTNVYPQFHPQLSTPSIANPA
jgi:hypothetical protein